MHYPDFTPVFLSRHQVDETAWNALITASHQCVVYAFTYYLDQVCQDWEALVWPTEHYRLAVPLPVRFKCGYRILYQPLFCQYLGIFSQCTLSRDLVMQVLQAINRRYAYISAYCFNPHNTGYLSNITFLNFKILHTQWLEIHDDPETIPNAYYRDRRTQLRRASHEHWALVPAADTCALIRLFKENHAGKVAGGVNNAAYLMLEKLFQCLKEKNLAEVWHAVKAGEVHAGILVVRHGIQAIYLFNAADMHGKRGHARTFLLDRYFHQHCGAIKTFDFESPEIASVAYFYEGFGAQRVPFLSINKNALPFPARILQEFRKVFFKTIQSLF
ncbi:GNAT family N-acetyltransferase [Dyadobacter sandarakinus]|uniref:GNAT family N-acetyltransferase n=1 Tax=Dyadobacter sandarakinus TaxID=2747268 RepID=A0ABX7I0Q8_9BACT|nr:GNAT family N-acetyltransferase [Dyadobacter sandarakinus]QRQ99407.1 GNAT family N-acetyltransferase [Dyadobacter sandarakinus]